MSDLPTNHQGHGDVRRELDAVREINRRGDNPNVDKPLIAWDFKRNKVLIRDTN